MDTDTRTIVTPIPDGSTRAAFIDVPSNAYYEEAVVWAIENGITSGESETQFAPAETCTRAQAVTFLWRAAGSPKASGENVFVDVGADAYYYDAVLWAIEQRVTSGATKNTFEPYEFISRSQVACFLYRYEGSPETTVGRMFTDVPSTAYYDSAVRWAVSAGITAGTSRQTFSPTAACSRAEIVTFLYRNSGEYVAPAGTEFELLPVDQALTKEQIDEELAKPDVEGAKAALINGFQKMDTSIDVEAYNIESSAAQDLAVEIAGLDEDENEYYIFSIWSPAPMGQKATDVEVQYQCALEEAVKRREADKMQQAAIERIVSSIVKQGMSEYDTAKALHDYIVLHTAYDMRYYSGEAPDSAYTAFGALVDGTAVCQGYALAYQALLTYCGIECQYVSGVVRSGRHGWNIVSIDGEWYHVDTTWDDPTPDRKGYVRYNYFLKSDAVMSRDHHNWKSDYMCKSTKYDKLELLSSEEEEQKRQADEEQVRKDAVTAEILVYCDNAIAAFPYRNKAELQAAEILSYEDSLNYIYFPVEEYDFEDLFEVRRDLGNRLKTSHPDYQLNDINRSSLRDGCWYYTIRRDDVFQELERRKILQETAEKERKAAAISEILQICYDAMAEFPYSSETELRSVEKLSYADSFGYIYFPIGKYNYDDLQAAQDELRTQISITYPDYIVGALNSERDLPWCLTIFRDDVERELVRRRIPQGEAPRSVAATLTH